MFTGLIVDVNSVTVSGTDSDGGAVEEEEITGVVSTPTAAVVTDGVETAAAFTTVTITLPVDVDGDTDGDQPLTFRANTEITLVFAAGINNPDVATTATAKIDDETGEVGVGVTLDTNTETLGANARVIVEVATGDGEALTAGSLEEVVIDMGKFGLPSSIDEDDVSLRGLSNATPPAETGRGTPASVTISGSKVTITVDDMDQGEDSPTFQGLSQHFRVIFSTGAGITIPAIAGDYAVKAVQVTNTSAMDTEFGDDGVASNTIRVDESLSIKPDKGATGTEVTVTGKGFGNDITSLFIDKVRKQEDDDDTADVDESELYNENTPDGKPESDEYEIATNIDVVNGAFSYTFTVDSNFSDISYSNVLKTNGESYRKTIHVDDSNAYPTFTVTGSMSLSTDSAQPGEEITVTLDDFSVGVAKATIGGEPLFAAKATTGGADDIPVDIPTGLAVGKHQIKVTVIVEGADDETGTADITIAGLPLTVSPSTAVPGQEITIRGSGFSKDGKLVSVDIGGMPASLDRIVHITSSGTFVATVTIPPAVSGTGDAVLVEVQEDDGSETGFDGNNRVGTARITIPKPTLTLNPTESRADTTVTAGGTGFVARSVVSIDYDGTLRLSVTADSLGNWTQAFRVPIDREPGTAGTVTAEGNGKSKSVDHRTLGPTISVTPASGRPGATITINGIDFKAYAPVTAASIGGLTIPTGATNTDEDGNFTLAATLPSLPSGTQSLTVSVNNSPETVVFTITEAGPATLPSADAFASLISANNLIVVWYFDNDTKGWSFYDPRPEVAAAVDLDMVTSGDNVWIQITADQEFQGEMLTAGWNLHTLQ